ncbi:MAG: ATP-binding protein [Bacteroidota bacterium]
MGLALPWWMVAGVTAVAGVMIVLIRRRQAEENARTRERIAGDLHDDVAPILSSIALFAASLKQKLQAKGVDSDELLDRISLLSLDAVDSLSDVVWTVSPNRDTLNDLFTRMKDFASEICTASGVAYDIDIGQVPEPPLLKPEVRKNLFLIVKEAMTNSARHSHASHVRITAAMDEGNVRLVVQDNGKGFIIRRTSSGISVLTGFRKRTERGHGLRSMEKRAKDIGAQLSIVSSPADGTTMTVTWRLS